jgi:hypothetical protein
MFRVDADTFLCLHFEEQLPTANAIDAAGNQVQGLTKIANPAVVTDGPYSGKRARRCLIAGAGFSAAATVDHRPQFRGDCTVQTVFRSRNHGSGGARSLYKVGHWADWYFYSQYRNDSPLETAYGIKLLYQGSQAGPNTGGQPSELVVTGLIPPADEWLMLTVVKTVISGNTDANKLNRIDVWLTRLGDALPTVPQFTRSNVVNPNATNHALYHSVAYNSGYATDFNDVDVAGIRCVARALNATEIADSLTHWQVATATPVSVSPVAVVPTVYFSETQDFGQDFSTFPDLSGGMALLKGGRVLSEALLRRFSTNRGELPFHPDFGFNLRDFLSEGLTDEQLFYLKASMEAEAEKDERIDQAVVDLTFNRSTQALTARLRLLTAVGPYSLTLLVTQLRTELLEAA